MTTPFALALTSCGNLQGQDNLNETENATSLEVDPLFLSNQENLAAANPCIPAVPAVQPVPIVYSGPALIRKPGTYTGNWQSINPQVPAVTITTSGRVILVHSNLRGPGTILQVSVAPNLTVCYSTATGTNPNIPGKVEGRFLNSDSGQGLITLEVLNTRITGTRGIYILGGPALPGGTIHIQRNRVVNIDARLSNGTGGFSTSDNANDDGDHVGQFVQLDSVQSSVDTDVSWNQVTNDPYVSRIEDNINVCGSSGTVKKNILIHDNYIRGAYPTNPTSPQTANGRYSGGGIMSADCVGTGFVKVYNNTVISTSNYGIAAAGGHDVTITGNRVLSSGLLADGKWVVAQNVGAYAVNYASDPKWGNIVVSGNLIGWRGPSGGRNDTFQVKVSANSYYPDPLSLAMEASELKRWLAAVKTQKISIGP